MTATPTSPGSIRPLLVMAALLLAAGLAAFSVDLPLSWLVMEKAAPRANAAAAEPHVDHLPKDLRHGVDLAEIFAHGAGVALLAIALFALDASGRRYLPRILLCAYGAGLAAVAIKLAVARVRPVDFDFAGGVWTSFAAIRPWFDHTSAWQALGVHGRGLESFPSGHAATAAGLAAALAWRYPHAAWFFALAAALAGMQRILSGAHYTSDVLLGASLGLAVAALLLAPGGPLSLLDRWENADQSQSK